MIAKCSYFIKILRAELEDLQAGLKYVEERFRERFATSEITNYVLLENEALLNREEESVRQLLACIDGMDVARYKNVHEIIEDLDAAARDFIKTKEYPAAVHQLLRRKLDKVLAYVAAGDAP